MADLSTTLAGVKIRNPIGAAAMLSVTGIGRRPRRYADMILKHVELGAGFVYTPGTSVERQSPLEKLKASTRMIRASVPGIAEKIGTFAICDPYIFLHRMDNTLEVIRILKEQLPKDVPLIGDLIGPGDDLAGWVEGAKLLEQAGVNLLELDTSCPFPATVEKREGRGITAVLPDEAALAELQALGVMPLLGDLPRVLGSLIEAIVKEVKIPVGFKMTAETGFPLNIVTMKVAARAGARFACSINSPITIAPPDIYHGGKPLYPYMDINAFGATGGPWLRPLVLRNVGAGCVFAPELEHGAVGGIAHPTQAVEYLMLGAKHIGLASALYLTSGVKAIPRFINFLQKFMDEHGYERMDDLIGIARKYIRPVNEDTDWGGGRIVARVDRDKCTECGLCIDGYCHGVLSTNETGQIIVDEETCCACGYCVVICPEDALCLVEKEVPSSATVEWP